MDDEHSALETNGQDLASVAVCAALVPSGEATEVTCRRCGQEHLFVEAGETRVPLCEHCWMIRLAATRGFHLGL